MGSPPAQQVSTIEGVIRDMFAEVFSYDQELIDSGIEKGIEKGVKQGMEKGRQDAKLEDIDAFLDLLDDKTIAERLKVDVALVRERRQLLGL